MKYIAETTFNEDGSCDVRARIMAKDATGSTASNQGEGYAVQRANLSAISLSVYDVTDEDNPTLVSGPTALTVSDVIVDSLVTTAAIWKTDAYGYNFAYVLPPTSFPTGGHVYQAEWKFTTTGSVVAWMKVRGKAIKAFTS